LLLVLILVTAAGLGGFLFGDRLAGLSGEESGQVPVVHAAEGAIKVRPDNPGGQDIPFRDYDINNDKFPCRMDVLYGYKAIRPQLACRIGNN